MNYEWTSRQMDIKTHRQMAGWMENQMEKLTDNWTYRWMYESIGWMYESVD